jgi:hypothetical protein
MHRSEKKIFGLKKSVFNDETTRAKNLRCRNFLAAKWIIKMIDGSEFFLNYVFFLLIRARTR